MSLQRRIEELERRTAARDGGGPIRFTTIEFYADDPLEEIEAKRAAARELAGWQTGNGLFTMVEVIKAR